MRLGDTSGYALIVVLWLITLLATMTMSYNASARVEAKLLAQSVYRAQAEAFAEAGIWLAVREHFESGRAFASRPAADERNVEFRGATIHVSIADVSGKINLNSAPAELIDAALVYAAVAPADRERLVHAIFDWRDVDDEKRPKGAEDRDYAGNGHPYGAKDAAFATVDELYYVTGMTADVVGRISPLLTVQGDHTRVNIAAAPAEVLSALPGIEETTVDDLLRRRMRGDSTDALEAGSLDRRFTQRGGTDIYVLTATAEAGGATARITATVRYARGETELIQVLAWESSGA